MDYKEFKKTSPEFQAKRMVRCGQIVGQDRLTEGQREVVEFHQGVLDLYAEADKADQAHVRNSATCPNSVCWCKNPKEVDFLKRAWGWPV